MVKRHIRFEWKYCTYIVQVYWMHRLFTDFYYSTILLPNNHTLLKSPRLFPFYSFLTFFLCWLLTCCSPRMRFGFWDVFNCYIACYLFEYPMWYGVFSIFISSLYFIYNRIRGKYGTHTKSRKETKKTEQIKIMITMNTSPLNIVSNDFCFGFTVWNHWLWIRNGSSFFRFWDHYLVTSLIAYIRILSPCHIPDYSNIICRQSFLSWARIFFSIYVLRIFV